MNGVAALADHGADMFIFNVSFAVGFGFPHCAAPGKDFKAVAITVIVNDLLGIRAAKADKRVSKPGLGAFFHTGIAGVGFAFGVDRGFEVVEGKEGVIVQAIGVVNAVHCEVDIAGVGDGDGGVGDGLEKGEFLLKVGNQRFPHFGMEG